MFDAPPKSYYVKHMTAAVIYLSLLLFFIYSALFRAKGVIHPLPEVVTILDNYRIFFFTSWNFGIQILFLNVAILDALSLLWKFPVKTQKFLHGTRSVIFNGLVVPIGLVVASVFWTLYNYDRELIYPPAIDKFLPNWMNHTLHTAILIPIVIELLLPKYYSFVTFNKAISVMTSVLLVYQIIYFYIYFTANVWLYPFFNHLNWFSITLVTLLVYSLACCYAKTGVEIQKLKKTQLTRPPTTQKRKKQK